MPLFEEDSDGILSAFRGLASGRNLGTAPQSPRESIDKILLDLKLSSSSPIKSVIENWANIVPQRFLGMSEPSDLGANILYVRTFNSTAKQELMFQERIILKKIRELGGCANIKKIKFL